MPGHASLPLQHPLAPSSSAATTTTTTTGDPRSRALGNCSSDPHLSLPKSSEDGMEGDTGGSGGGGSGAAPAHSLPAAAAGAAFGGWDGPKGCLRAATVSCGGGVEGGGAVAASAASHDAVVKITAGAPARGGSGPGAGTKKPGAGLLPQVERKKSVLDDEEDPITVRACPWLALCLDWTLCRLSCASAHDTCGHCRHSSLASLRRQACTRARTCHTYVHTHKCILQDCSACLAVPHHCACLHVAMPACLPLKKVPLAAECCCPHAHTPTALFLAPVGQGVGGRPG